MIDDSRVRIIGIGCHPAQLTAEARGAIAACDYVIAAEKGPSDALLALRRAICEDVGTELVAVPDPERDRSLQLDGAGYDTAVIEWHEARARVYRSLITSRPGTVGFLVWGDPAYYDSTIRVVDRLGCEYDVLPGISALSLLAARHRVVLHEVGRPVLVTTGRRLAAEVEAGHDNLVVMLDGRLQAASLEGDWDIWWGANLGSPHEELVAGRLSRVLPDIEAARARAKRSDGWVMDTYLLRRSRRSPLVYSASFFRSEAQDHRKNDADYRGGPGGAALTRFSKLRGIDSTSGALNLMSTTVVTGFRDGRCATSSTNDSKEMS